MSITYPATNPLARTVPSREQFGERERGDSGGDSKCSYVTPSRPMSPQPVCTCVYVCVCVCMCVYVCVNMCIAAVCVVGWGAQTSSRTIFCWTRGGI